MLYNLSYFNLHIYKCILTTIFKTANTLIEVVTICCLVHFFIVAASIVQPDGTAPMAGKETS